MTESSGSGAEIDDERAKRRGPHGIETDDDPCLDTEESWTQVAQAHFDPEGDEALAVTIVAAIATAEGVDPTTLKHPPLYDVVDASAIQQSFFGSHGHARDATGVAQFRYEQYLLKVRSDGWVQVYS